MQYLLDVNVVLALLTENHAHHPLVISWFRRIDSDWFMCAFAEAGFVRNITALRPGHLTMKEATASLKHLAQQRGYRYLAIEDGWLTLCSPFFARLQGSKQVTDAYLLGLAVRNDLVLVTMDKAILHLAGVEFRGHVLVLEE